MTVTRINTDDTAAAATPTPFSRILRGITSSASLALFPLGRWGSWGTARLSDPGRLQHGLVLILPGIDGRSLLSLNIALGLADAGVRSCIEIVDWTTGLLPLALLHLRSRKLHQGGAQSVADRIEEYSEDYAGSPIHVIGHSGGGGVALYALDQLASGRRITSAFLLGPAVSPQYDVAQALRKTNEGIWNYYSRLDAVFLQAVTSVCGTIDGKHSVSAGAVGFRSAAEEQGAGTDGKRLLHQRGFTAAMLSQFHLGGHFGWTNRVFVAEEIAPRILSAENETASRRR